MPQLQLMPGQSDDGEGVDVERRVLSDLRVRRPVRNKLEMEVRCLDWVLPEEHPARAIWDLVCGLDLSGFHADIKALSDGPGRPASDPTVLLALWVYATVNEVGSARQLARLCAEHDAYRWLCGGVPVNYHMLSDFRVAHEAALDDLLAEIIALLMDRGLLEVEKVAHDGMRVRASAGQASFRRRGRLEALFVAAHDRVERLARQREHPDPGTRRREQAARERAARERRERVAEVRPRRIARGGGGQGKGEEARRQGCCP